MDGLDTRIADIRSLISSGSTQQAIDGLKRIRAPELESTSLLPLLREACVRSDEIALIALLGYAPVPSPFSGMECSLACACCEHGSSQCLRHLLEAARPQPSAFDFAYALYDSCKHGHAACAKLLLSAGANPDMRHPASKNSPIEAAVASDHFDCALALLQAGAQLDTALFQTELIRAASKGNPRMVSLLLSHGADPSSQTFNGQSARQVALSHGHERAAELIDAAERLADAQAEAIALQETLHHDGASPPRRRI